MSRRILYFIVFAVIAAALLFVPLPVSPSYAQRTIENAGHTPLFFLATLFVLYVLRHDFRVDGGRLYVLAGLIGAGAGLMSEIIQKPLRRDGSWEDVWADSVGVMCALALYSFFDRGLRGRLLVRTVAVLVTLAGVAIYVAPLINMVRAYQYRNAQFPTLADFQSDVKLERVWVVGYGVRRELGRGALDVQFASAKYPGVSFFEPVEDWRRYRTLVIDVENPDEQALQLVVRVHDERHNYTFRDRFNRNYELAPGERRTIRIALEDVRNSPRERLMDMAKVSDITLLRRLPSGSAHMRLYSMRLE